MATGSSLIKEIKMQSFGKFEKYTPEDKEPIPGYDVLYLRDDQDNDWYDAQKLFSEDTIKVAYDESGAVRSYSIEVHRLVPVGLSVIELPATKANLRVTLGEDWFYKDGKLQQIRDYVAIATAERDSRMRAATARIDWLAAAVEDGDASDSEEAELAALRAYRTALRRLDLTVAPDVKWPETPAA